MIDYGYPVSEKVEFIPRIKHWTEQTYEERFWSRVDKSDDCWEWTRGKFTSGYGSVYFKGKRVQTHRVSWVLTFGEIPEHDSYHGMCVLHKCDNPGCVNPDHLFLGTQQDNITDMIHKHRAKWQ